MCAIAGIVTAAERSINPHALAAMTEAQAHRGPDGEGYVFLSHGRRSLPRAVSGPLPQDSYSPQSRYSVGLSHRRLAILDLSAAGHQPMSSPDQRCWITYNGELYNYRELRDELRSYGHVFRSQSDTEVLLTAYCQWGTACLHRFNGMFAFALWDAERRTLFCGRDRMGEKPLYYAWDGITFTFASELKALLPVMGQPTPNQRLIHAYLDGARLDFSQETFIEQTRQLEPGHYLLVKDGTLHHERYWELPAGPPVKRLSSAGVVEEFRHLIEDAVRLRLRSDVPIGSCLSGGLDSSAIVCLADRLLPHADTPWDLTQAAEFKTFSACFEDPRYDERPFIRQVVEATAVTSQRTFPTAKELLDCLERLVWQQDEPFGSTSIFAQWTVMRSAAENGVKVLLDGQGADELMAGYHGCFGAFYADLFREGRWRQLWHEWSAYRGRYACVPPQLPANFVRGLFPPLWVGIVRRFCTGTPRWMAPDFARAVHSTEEPDHCGDSILRGMQHRLLTRHGLRALLRYEDRNSMAFGIETRLPFLDVRLVEFLFCLQSDWKLRDGWTKVILRQSLQGLLPDGIRRRVDKLGFATPEDDWFRGDLAAYARDVLLDSRSRARRYLHIPGIEQELTSHLSGQRSIGATIWRWVNLELWCRLFLDRRACVASLS
jgi:asparagine synthase (glutamine-hydrolysing)